MPNKQRFLISGTVSPGFEPVRAAFETNFTRHGEVGAAVHVTLDGVPVVDLWGGAAQSSGEARPDSAWTPDTLVNVWSTTKGWVALAMHLLASRGLLDFDAPVARYWPEFAQNGKGGVLIRHILTHTAGLPGPSMQVPDEAVYDFDQMVHFLEQSKLFWEPGTQVGYHAATFGWLNGEVIRRVSGRPVNTFLREEIAGPMGADTLISLSADEMARTADTLPPGWLGALIFKWMLGPKGKPKSVAFSNPPRPANAVNTPRWRTAVIPSSNGHASARGLARLYTVLALGGAANGVRLLPEAAVALAAQEQIHAKDVVTGVMTRRALGFMLPDTELGDPRPLTAFGHPGMGGSAGFADPSRRLAMGYVMNRMIIGLDPRFFNLARAVYAGLDQR